ncbi:Wall-associated receptor kinase 2 [Acorus calamus]|uniref:Wall-associated receptor kinase 2 n=1 Tax=Acorus calamus TaxID=4465 RepID=A0AAV9CNP2_ACOCL|nr:Wall-associated receptor kinase 2 [Acorus calamus]
MMILVVLLLHQFLCPTPSVASQAKPGCQDTCGNLTNIPYPFGIGPNCYRDQGFAIDCNSTDHGSVPYLSGGNILINDIYLLTGEMNVSTVLALDCYYNYGNQTITNNSGSFANLWSDRTYTFSDSRNKFTVLGCDTRAYFTDVVLGFTTGCISVCSSPSMVTNGSCNGIGCCQTSIPKGVRNIDVEVHSFSNNSSRVNYFNPCNYAFLVDQEVFIFHGISDFSSDFYERNDRRAPVVLDWVIRNQTCADAVTASDYACVSQNSTCYDAPNGDGYRCNCSAGYRGNPYLKDNGGCKDIDECSMDGAVAYPCKGICTNTPGSYLCNCRKGKHSDDPKLFECRSSFPVIPVALGIGIPFILILIGSWIFLGHQMRKLNNLKDQFFEQNGGLHLQQLLSSNPNITFKIFSKEDIERATDKFNQNNILGQGGQGMVFKGVLPDNRVVAVKKSMVVNEMQNTQFANEMIILSQINHRNVVKLLGCCVEVEVPMLVYEYISNGTLFHLIHGGRLIPLKDRLRIVTETASAIAYLHSAASPPILHGDIKSSNILLDANYMAKVSDFGASKLTPLDKDQFATFMQGTWGYLDPECLQTGQLTDKSDVYSFGVVLAEFLTRKKAVTSVEGIVKEKSLANTFVTSMKENRILEVLDPQILKEGRIDLIIEVCKLITRCLSMTGEERPTMKEVAMELEGLAMFEIHSSVPYNPEEMESLLGQSSCNCGDDSTGLYSLEKRAALSIEGGR